MGLTGNVYVVGVGMTKFQKPGGKIDYPEMAKEAVTKALNDARLSYESIQQACVGYVYGDSTCGQRALYTIGLTGIPIFNSSIGSTALIMAKQLIDTGKVDCVLALGFDKMERGSLKAKFTDRELPTAKHIDAMVKLHEPTFAPRTAQMFGNAGEEHMRLYGTTPEHCVKIAHKNHKHSINNPYAQFRKEYTLEEIRSSQQVFKYLTRLQCCPTSDGAAACILASARFVHEHGLEKQAVEIVGIEMATDTASTFEDNNMMNVVGYDMTKRAATKLYFTTGLSPSDIDVVELHDSFTSNELILYEALSLCAEGKAGEMIDRADNTYGGRYVINPSGGLISRGHPLGATALAQCVELCWQLRGEAEMRQVVGARLALQHNIVLGGSVIVALYRLGFINRSKL